MSNRILITGATGFVGSHILEAFLQKGAAAADVVACRNPENLPESFLGEVRVGDLRDRNYIENIVKGVDIICHAAAWTSLWDHKIQSEVNFLQPTLNLIQIAKAAGVKQFIFPSTTSVVNSGAPGHPKIKGKVEDFWPHLNNVIKIERMLKDLADPHFSTIILRLGIFTGTGYGVGLLPILLPRLKTHLVPWIAGGSTTLPLIDGKDIGRAFLLASQAEKLDEHEIIDIIGEKQPAVRELLDFIHKNFGYPRPHFSIPFKLAYAFAWLMEKIDPVLPWEPLVTRSIVHLLEPTPLNTQKAARLLGYKPLIDWKQSVQSQILELHQHQKKALSMAAPIKHE